MLPFYVLGRVWTFGIQPLNSNLRSVLVCISQNSKECNSVSYLSLENSSYSNPSFLCMPLCGSKDMILFFED